MTISYKVLGQINPTANTLTTAYTVPASNSTVISTITVCNQNAAATTFRLAIQPGGAAIAAKHYLNYDTSLPGSDTITLTLGLTMAATDVLSANVASANVSIGVFGSEIY